MLIQLAPGWVFKDLRRCEQIPCPGGKAKIIAMVTLQTFYLGKFDLLTVYQAKRDFLAVTDFSLGNLRPGNFIVWGLDMSREQYSFP